jgi:hypothetical protein
VQQDAIRRSESKNDLGRGLSWIEGWSALAHASAVTAATGYQGGKARLATVVRQTKMQDGTSSRRFEIRPLGEQTATRHLRTSG